MIRKYECGITGVKKSRFLGKFSIYIPSDQDFMIILSGCILVVL
jgi:hypothetical protein